MSIQLFQDGYAYEAAKQAGHWSDVEIATSDDRTRRTYQWERRAPALTVALKRIGFITISFFGLRFLSPNFRKRWADAAKTQQTAQVSIRHVVLLVPLIGNPAHLGQMATVPTAIHELQKHHFIVDEVLFSLSSQACVEQEAAGKELNEVPVVVHTYEERRSLLEETIAAARTEGMFNAIPEEDLEALLPYLEGFSTVPVRILDEASQNGFNIDHPRVYQREVAEHPNQDVVLVAGDDVCESMHNWPARGDRPALQHAIVIERNRPPRKPNPPGTLRRFIPMSAFYAHYSQLSSTALQTAATAGDSPVLVHERARIRTILARVRARGAA